MQSDYVKRCRISRAVIRRVRDELEMGQFAISQFMHDLAGFSIAEIVTFLRLPAPQHLKRTSRELGVYKNIL